MVIISLKKIHAYILSPGNKLLKRHIQRKPSVLISGSAYAFTDEPGRWKASNEARHHSSHMDVTLVPT